MRTFKLVALSIVMAVLAARAQGPTFDVVSIKANTSGALGSNGSSSRPDGGFTLLNIPIGVLISRAYPPAVPADMVGLPGWAMSERYDVAARSPLPRATPDERAAMMRAMLADRMKLAAHFENREQETYHLVLARRDGRLGSGLTKIETDCDAQAAASNAGASPQRQPPDYAVPPPPCTWRIVPSIFRDRFGDHLGQLGDLVEGEITMANLAFWLRTSVRRVVVDKTGLAGSYRVRMNVDSMAAMRPPSADAPASDVPTIFTALPEQLGLKLESSRDPRPTLVIDHLERPTEN